MWSMPAVVLRNLATLAVVLVVYFAAPVGELPSAWAVVLSVLGLIAGCAVLGALIVGQIRRHLRAGHDESVRLQSLLTLVYVSIVLFALGYFALERAADRQFADLDTKVDALYFTMSTLATVGFGDVHATGQIARALVTVQMVFNLVFIGALVSVLGTQVRERAAAARSAASEEPG